MKQTESRFTRLSRSGVPVLSRSILLPVVFLAGSSFPAAAQQRYRFQVVVNRDDQISSLSLEQVAGIYRKRTKQWQTGAKAAPVDLPENSAVREEFTKVIHGTPVATMTAFWQREIFADRGAPSVVIDSDAAVLAFIAENPSAIGYVSRDVGPGPIVPSLRRSRPSPSEYSVTDIDPHI